MILFIIPDNISDNRPVINERNAAHEYVEQRWLCQLPNQDSNPDRQNQNL